MNITVEKNEKETILHVEGRVDTNTAADFENAVLENMGGAECLRLDFEKVAFVSSAGLRALLNGQKKANAEDKQMILCNINEVVEEVLDSTGFIDILEVE